MVVYQEALLLIKNLLASTKPVHSMRYFT